jgi:hypothetical protein
MRLSLNEVPLPHLPQEKPIMGGLGSQRGEDDPAERINTDGVVSREI